MTKNKQTLIVTTIADQDNSPQESITRNHPGFYINQESDFLKFLAIVEWLDSSTASFSGSFWVELSFLYHDYKKWIANHTMWTCSVLCNPSGFSKRLKHITLLKGRALISTRQNGKRGLRGISIGKE